MAGARAVAASVIIAALALITACGSPHHTTQHHATAAAVAATPATTAPASFAPSDEASPVANTALDDWCGGDGYSDFQTVQSDISQIGTDSGNDNLIALESDGSQMMSDAETAGHALPPFSKEHTLDYGLYMGWLLVGGEKLNQGDVDSAVTDFKTASSYLNKVSSLVTDGCGS